MQRNFIEEFLQCVKATLVSTLEKSDIKCMIPALSYIDIDTANLEYCYKFFHSQDLLSRNVLSNVPAPKAVSSHTAIDRWSDYIGQLVRDSHHLGILLTILQHFTHNEIQ